MLFGYEHFYGEFQRVVETVALSGRVLDVGTTHKFRKELAPFVHLFSDYIAIDFRAQSHHGNLNVDIDGDVHQLPVRTESVDGILCVEVLEHVTDPRIAVQELYRVLKPGGVLLLTAPFMHAMHSKPGDYSDLFRFTDDGLRVLLRDFADVEVHPKGGLIYRLLITLTPTRIRRPILTSRRAMSVVNALDRKRPTRSPLGWIVEAHKPG